MGSTALGTPSRGSALGSLGVALAGAVALALSFIGSSFSEMKRLRFADAPHWMFLPPVDLVHPWPIRPCDSLTHDTPWIVKGPAQMHPLPRQPVPQGHCLSDDRGLGLAATGVALQGNHWHSSLRVQALCLALTVCTPIVARLWHGDHIFVKPNGPESTLTCTHSNSPSPYTLVERSRALASALSLAFSSCPYPSAFLPASLGSIL